MESHTQEFLESYKELERSVEEIWGISMKEYEDGNPDEEKKLQICRLLRNYASHHTDLDSFCPVPKEAVDYVRELNTNIKRSQGTIKDYMQKLTPVKATDTKAEAMRRLCTVWKNTGIPKVPMADADGRFLGLLTTQHLISFEMSKDQSGTAGSFKPSLNAAIVSKDTYMCDVNELLDNNDMLIVAENGKYKGILIKNQEI